ncbi:MAG: hypothetical protein FVQ80_07120 [Planctomycetes bacterium]|nr:hypothetical protein [Planctomycetota bacterium]
MGQTYNVVKPEAGVTIFGELYQILRDHFDAAITNMVGAAAPGSPAEGWTWYDSVNDKMQAYDGASWRDIDYNTSVYTDVLNSRGTAASLDARLDVSINEDGTLSGSSPAGAWWTAGTSPWAYVGQAVQFKENGDKRSVYTIGRAIKLNGVTGAPQYSSVTAVAYAAATTTVTLKDGIVSSSMTTPEFGQPIENFHRKIPWTRGFYSNSATSRDYAPTGFALLADGSGGVTAVGILSAATAGANHKKYGIM